jgi:hypothetical protein
MYIATQQFQVEEDDKINPLNILQIWTSKIDVMFTATFSVIFFKVNEHRNHKM